MGSYTFTENSTSQNSADTPTTGVTEDCGMAESDPASNQDAFGGFETSRFGSGDHQNIIITFDTSSIPDSETITSANLHLHNNSNDAAHLINVHEMLRAGWTEGGNTWNTYDGTNSWTTGGCRGNGTDRSTSTVGSQTVGPASSQYYSFSISTTVISKTGETRLMLEMDPGEGESADTCVWERSENTDGQRPELVVITSVGGGEEAATIGSGLINSIKLRPARLIG